MQKKNTGRLMALVLTGMLAAVVFVLSLISIPIPLALGDNTRIHLGNIMCLVSGVLFGPVVGGLAAGLGSMLYDFTNPLYVSEFWITFLTKFAMGFVAGLLARYPLAKMHALPRALLAALGGQFTYIALYIAKSAIMQHYVYGNPWSAALAVVAGKALISTVNGLIAVICCTLLAPALGAALNRAGLFRKLPGHTA